MKKTWTQALLASICVVGLQPFSYAKINAPSTPLAVQVSASGSGIAAVYRLNGPTSDGLYVGLYGASKVTSSEKESRRSTIGGWVGHRELIADGTYFAYGAELYSRTGTVDNAEIRNGYEGGPFVAIHRYLTENWYVSVYNNPVYVSSEEVSGKTSTVTTLFSGGVGLGYQF